MGTARQAQNQSSKQKRGSSANRGNRNAETTIRLPSKTPNPDLLQMESTSHVKESDSATKKKNKNRARKSKARNIAKGHSFTLATSRIDSNKRSRQSNGTPPSTQPPTKRTSNVNNLKKATPPGSKQSRLISVASKEKPSNQRPDISNINTEPVTATNTAVSLSSTVTAPPVGPTSSTPSSGAGNAGSVIKTMILMFINNAKMNQLTWTQTLECPNVFRTFLYLKPWALMLMQLLKVV